MQYISASCYWSSGLIIYTLTVDMTREEEDDQGERLINEGNKIRVAVPVFATANMLSEYKTWKKNSPFLYDMILGYVYNALSIFILVR